MTRLALIFALVGAVACTDGSVSSGDDTTSDSPTGCSAFVVFDPGMAIAGPSTEIRATANVMGAPGVLTYTWHVMHGGGNVTYNYALPDQSAVTFVAADAGPYTAMVSVNGTSAFCPTASNTINIGVEGGNTSQIRVRWFPPAGVTAPPHERLELVNGGVGAYSVGNVTVDVGVEASGQVKQGATMGVQSYLRFIPLGARDAYIEAFTAGDGTFTKVRLINQLHDVLVVPVVPGYAPRLITGWMPGTTVLSIDGGSTISGVVLDPASAPIANAYVQLELAGVPSTLTQTNASGVFSVLANVPTGTPVVTVRVTPQEATGLPRIEGSSMNLSTMNSITVQYSAALVRRDLGGTVVRRNGTAQANVPVTIAGTIGNVATITAGGSTLADGEVRITATTNGGGALPNGMLAPGAPLSAVTRIGSDFAVDAIDLTTAVPATINAPSMVQINTQLRNAAQAPLADALIDLQPSGALAMVSAPTIRAYSNSAGTATMTVPGGGRYDVRASDPLGRAAPLLIVDVPTASLASAYSLKPSLRISGTLILSGNPLPVGRAAVQILCTLCTGVERTRPLAEGATTSAGTFELAVFDPGVGQ